MPGSAADPARPVSDGTPRAGLLWRLVAAARDGWLILGVTLALFLVLESGYRLQAGVKHLVRGRPPQTWDAADHPYYGQAWYPEFSRALNRRSYALDPYRLYWPHALASRYLNIDSAGRRLTVNQPPGATRRVLLFGGSAAWGLTVRDSFTIASLLARELARRGVRDVEVLSDAQPGFNTTQEAVSLQLELARGVVPAAALFYNGYNDIASAVLSGRVGSTFLQDEAQTLLDLGRRGFWAQLFGLGRFSWLVTRLRPERPGRPAVEAARICPAVADYYARMERNVLALARDRGFPALVFLQPHHDMSHKHPSRWEATLPRDPRLAVCADSIAAAMAPEAGRSFFDLRPLFDGDTGTVFVDLHSHLTEGANAQVAAAMADHLVPLLLPHGTATATAARAR